MTNLQNLSIQQIRTAAIKERAKRSFIHFVTHTKSDYEVQWFHALLAQYLQDFVEGKIKKLMVSMPPQHGKSQLVSRHLPAYILGLKPKTKIVGCSYSSALSQSFNRDIKRLITGDEYSELFPDTQLNAKNVATDAKGAWLNNSEIFEIVKHGGFYKNVGVGGSLTGTAADIGIIDDPVKDASEADSVTVRGRVWDWYETVFTSRLHNHSQVLLTMTRWHVDDLAGRILKSADAKNWTVLTLPAIKEQATHHILDTRKEGEALWENRHSSEKIKMNTERVFQALYQQNPIPTKGGLVFPNTVIVDSMPDGLTKYGIGCDWGYSGDPTAAVHCGLDNKNKVVYLDQLIYETHLSVSSIAAKMRGYEKLELLCDHDIRIIDELKLKHGFISAKKAIKGKGSIQSGVALLQEYTLAITKRSFGLIEESQRYTYKTDGYGNPTDEPIGDFNHAWDAVRYYALIKLTKPNKGIWLTK